MENKELAKEKKEVEETEDFKKEQTVEKVKTDNFKKETEGNEAEKSKSKEVKGKEAGKRKEVKTENYLADLQRVQAEFENFRKRVEGEKKDWIDFGKKELLLELLAIFEGLEKAMQNEQKESGIKLIFEEFKKFLEKNGVREIECFGKKFNSNEMHVMNTGRNKEKEEEIVLEVFQKGFMFKESVLRPALVQVNVLKNTEAN